MATHKPTGEHQPTPDEPNPPDAPPGVPPISVPSDVPSAVVPPSDVVAPEHPLVAVEVPAARRWSTIYEAMVGASGSDDHDVDPPGASPESTAAGHEPDAFDARGILYVPALIVVTVVLAFGLITTLFSVLNPGQPTVSAEASPQAVADSKASYNDRVVKVRSLDETAEVKAPRLEAVQAFDNPRGEPVYARSFKPADTKDNPYHVTPRELYPEHFVDPQTGERSLVEYGWVSKGKGVARIPVDAAMRSLVGKLPTRKDGVRPQNATPDRPKNSNGGQVTITDKAPALPGIPNPSAP